MTTSIEEITPLKAVQYLDTVLYRRSVNPKKVARYAKEMTEGNWKEPPTDLPIGTLAFDAKGRLVDGQHILLAIVHCGLTLKIPVVKGVEDTGAIDLQEAKP